MNKSLIFKLSLFGLAMAFATVYVIPTKIEWIFWLVIFIICAYVIAKQCTEKYFLNGFLVSILNCVWITGAHILMYNTFMSNHPDEVEMMHNMPMPTHPRVMMLLTGPIFGIIFGLILGLFSFIASKLVKK